MVSLAEKGLISVHVSTVDPDVYIRLHPGSTKRSLDMLLDSVRRVIAAGYPASKMLNSVTFTGLQTSSDMIRTIDFFEEEFGIKTSLNVYHTYLRPGSPRSDLDRFIPRPDEVKKVYARYARQWGAIRLPMNCVNRQYCSATLAVLCDGSVTPCATIREKDAPNLHSGAALYDIAMKNKDHLAFSQLRNRGNLPLDCQRCSLSRECFGCRSRSCAADLGLLDKDPRCFRKNRSRPTTSRGRVPLAARWPAR